MMKKYLLFLFIIVSLHSFEDYKQIIKNTEDWFSTKKCKEISDNFSKNIARFSIVEDTFEEYIDKKVFLSRKIKNEGITLLEKCHIDNKNKDKLLNIMNRFILLEYQLMTRRLNPYISEKKINTIVENDLSKYCLGIRDKVEEGLEKRTLYQNKHSDVNKFSEEEFIEFVKINLELNKSIRKELTSCIDSKERIFSLIDILKNNNQIINLIKMKLKN